MLTRAVVNVASTPHTQKGQARLMAALESLGENTYYMARHYMARHEQQFGNSPLHSQIPYAFKSYALAFARDEGAETLIWADACILPIRSLEPVWEKIERDGYLLMNNGFSNYEWTADSAYPDFFARMYGKEDRAWPSRIEALRAINQGIPHTVGGFFGLSMRHELGRAFLAELYRLASTTRAFCGPWTGGVGVQHRHDQAAMSVIAWRLDMELTDCPEFFAYGKSSDVHDVRTVVIADGAY
jgi:hypothetical protein